MASINIGDVADEFYRYKMPPLQARVQGSGNGIKTCILNCTEIARALSRPPDYVLKYFGFALGAQTAKEPGDRYLVNGEHTTEALAQHVNQFIKKFVLCGACGNPETNIEVKKNSIKLHCVACGNDTKLDPSDKLFKYIQNHPPEDTKLKQTTTKVDKATAEKLEKASDSAGGPAGGASTNEVDQLADELDEIHAARQKEDPIDAMSAWVALHPEWTPEELVQEVEQTMRIHDFNVVDAVVMLFHSNVINSKSILARPKAVAQAFSLLCENSERIERPLFECMAEFFASSDSGDGKDVLAKLPQLLQLLYNSDIVEQRATLKWFRKCKAPDATKEMKRLRKAAKPFLDWLKAEEEDADQDDEEEDADHRS